VDRLADRDIEHQRDPTRLDLSAIEPIELNGKRAGGVTYEYLRDKILDGTLQPNGVISQVELARRLGVSRTPLREALRRLQQDGLIDAEPNRRARVTAIDPDDLEYVYTNRVLNETLGIALTVPKLSPEDLSVIRRALADMRSSVGAGEYAEWEKAHSQFHASLVVHAPDRLRQTIAAFAARGDRYRRIYQSRIPRAWTIGDADHEAIASACEARDQAAAATQLARHFARTALSLIASMVPERDPIQLRTALLLITGKASVE
jgi:DNA-binding GntR family transcriptional regulator